MTRATTRPVRATTVTVDDSLGIGKVGPATVTPEGVLAYQIVVTNTGPSDATNVVVSDTLPSALQNVIASAVERRRAASPAIC